MPHLRPVRNSTARSIGRQVAGLLAIVRRLAVPAMLLALSLGCEAASLPTVRMLNWGDYVDPRVLDDFARATGIRVVLDTYDSVAAMDEKIATADPPYDVVVTPAARLAPGMAAGKYRPIDYRRLPNAAGLMPEIEGRLAVLDPGNRHAVDYMWFTTGIAFNADAAAERLGTDDPTSSLDTWNAVFRPDLAKKFADCGLQIIDEADVLFPIALVYMGIGANPRYDADFVKASDLWGRLRAVTKLFSTPDAIASLADGNVCLAVVPADFAAQARQRANRAKNDIDIRFVVPREGAPLSFDVLAIPEAAQNVEAAYKLIDFLLRPDIAARNSNLTRMANAVAASKPLMDQTLATDPGVYPDDETMKNLFVAKPYDARQRKLVDRFWVKSKTGKLGS